MTASADPSVRRACVGRLAGSCLLLGALLTGLVAFRWSVLFELDQQVTRAAERADEALPGLLTAARLTTHLGDPLIVTVGSLALAGLLLARSHVRAAVFVLLARGGALVLSQSIKTAVDRPRPRFDAPVATAGGASFPSGHALGSAAFWTVVAVLAVPLVHRAWIVLTTGVAVALVVAASRVLLGVHYPSDVVAGFLLGVGWTVLLVTLLLPAPVRSRS